MSQFEAFSYIIEIHDKKSNYKFENFLSFLQSVIKLPFYLNLETGIHRFQLIDMEMLQNFR